MATQEAILNNPNATMYDVPPQPGPVPAPVASTPTYSSIPKPQQQQAPQEPAVVSSSTIAEKVIPQNNQTFNNLSDKGNYVDSTGNMRHSDGTLVAAPIGTESNNDGTWGSGGMKYGAPPQYVTGDDPESQKINDLIAGMKQSLDASTKKQVDVIEQNHALLVSQAQKANEGIIDSTRSALLNAGGRYSPATMGGRISAETSFGMQRIAALDAQENSQLAAAEKARNDGDQQLFDKALATVQATRTAKQKAAQDIIDSQTQKIQKAQDDQQLAHRDSAVGEIMARGITDPLQIMQELGKEGISMTAAEVHSALTNLTSGAPAGVADLIKTLQTNGAPADVVKKVLAAGNMNDAYAAAGEFAAGGSGIIGEYNYYRAQAIKNGQVPVDFNTYQNQDANRKAKATASAGSSETVNNLAQQLIDGNLAPSELSKRTTGSASYNDVLKAADDLSMKATGKHFNLAQADRDYKFATRPQTQDTLNYLGSLVGSDNGNGKVTGGNLDELVSLSNSITRTSFPALNDTAAWARLAAGDAKMAQFQAVSTEVADQVAKILQGGSSGGGTSDAKLQQAANLFNTGFSKKQLAAVVDALKPLLANRAKSMIKDNPYLSDYADQFGIKKNTDTKTGDTMVQNEKGAQDAIVAAVKTDPKLKDQVRGLLGGTYKGIDHPLSYSEVQQYLQATGALH